MFFASPFLMVLLVGAIIVVPFWKIFEKAGFPPAMSFFMLIPVVNLVMVYVLAFSEWPSRRTG